MEHKDGALIDPHSTVQFALDRFCRSDDDRSILTDALTAIMKEHDFGGGEILALLWFACDIIDQRAAKANAS